jgi:hypothetical protein
VAAFAWQLFDSGTVISSTQIPQKPDSWEQAVMTNFPHEFEETTGEKLITAA